MAGPTQLAIVASVMLAAACGGSSVNNRMPAQDAARAQASIHTANMAGAQPSQRAKAHLAMAKQSAANAQNLTKRGEDEAAKLLFSDAKADADLALALNKQQQAETQCQQAKRRLEGAQ